MSVPTGYVTGAKQEARAARVEARQEFTPTPGGVDIERAVVAVVHETELTYDVDVIGDDGEVRGRVVQVAPLVPATLAVGDMVAVAWLAGDDDPVILVSGGGGGTVASTDLGVLMD